MLRIHEIKLNLGEEPDVIPLRIIKKLNVRGLEIKEYQLVKESLDARNKTDIKLVYSVDFIPYLPGRETGDAEAFLLNKSRGAKLEKAPDMGYRPVSSGSAEMKHRPVIAGFGPCGMFAGLILSEMGYKPVILERGKPIAERIRDVDRFWSTGMLDEESNVQFGEGGAGLFSDGKLTTQTRDPRIRKVLEEFVEAGGDPSMLYKQKPHIGTDVLRRIVLNIRKKIIENGGEVLFQSKLSGLVIEEAAGVEEAAALGETDGTGESAGARKIKGILVNGDRQIDAETLILAIGHSARDTFRALDRQGVAMSQKPFSIGVRIEHPQPLINEAQYGEGWEEYGLGAADYKLSHHCENGRGVYTFCMCPGGYVIGAASQKGCVVTNGMSYQDRGSALANSGLLVDVRTEDFPNKAPLAGIEFQEKYEKLAFEAGGGGYLAPAQKLKDFMRDGQSRESADGSAINSDDRTALEPEDSPAVEPTYRPGTTWTDLSKCLPEFTAEAMREAIPAFGRKMRGFDAGDAVMTGVETRSSSPVRIPRDENLVGSVEGLYPAGEGAGYAGGIMSAAVDGIKVAEEIIKRYAPL
ncbi:MAG TPA: hypothetical protein PKA19_06725 [Bacillota bacterium]|nr:hypothetical protein [Bacillota bacterium]